MNHPMRVVSLICYLAVLPVFGICQANDVVTTAGGNLAVTTETTYLEPAQNRGTGLREMPITNGTTTTARLGMTTGPIAFDEATMMRPEDLRPGMKGYGLTVFSGIRPEKFEAEVVGVRHRAFPGDDMILCMLSSPYLEGIGVIAGMSGSPVYMEGKLIGAVAYGWSFSREPLAGITPIESMLDVYNSTSTDLRDSDELEGSTYRAYEAYRQMYASASFSPYQHTKGATAVEIPTRELPYDVRSRYQLPDTVTMQPLSTPLFISSASPRTAELVQRLFSNLDVQPVQMGMSSGGGVGSAEAENSPGGKVTDLQALADEINGGYGLAIPFVEGDLNMAGVGTVTYRHADKLVAFGHPMFEMGIVAYPMAPARINALVRNIMRPFKLGEPLGHVGIVRQDRLPAIGGVFGETARMFPVHASIVDTRYQGKRDYNYQVWDDRDYGPALVMTTLMESISGGARSAGDSVALYNYTLSFDDGTSFTKEDYQVDMSGSAMVPVRIGSEVGMIVNNPYKRVRPERVDFNIRVADRLPQANIRTAVLDKPAYKPGETVTVRVELEPYRRPIEHIEYAFTLPENMNEGEYDLRISDGHSRESLERSRNPGGDNVISYETLLETILRNYPKNKLYFAVQDEDTGVSVRGRELPKLPSSIIRTIEATGENAFVESVKGNIIVDAEVVTAFEVSGTKTLTVEVTRDKL